MTDDGAHISPGGHRLRPADLNTAFAREWGGGAIFLERERAHMSTNRANSAKRPGGRKPSKRGHRAKNLPTSQRDGSLITNLTGLAAGIDASHVVMTFDRPVTAGNPASPGATDIQFVASGGTTRNVAATVQTRPNVVTCGLSGALTATKTYTGTIAVNQGCIVLTAGQWGTRAKTIAT